MQNQMANFLLVWVSAGVTIAVIAFDVEAFDIAAELRQI